MATTTMGNRPTSGGYDELDSGEDDQPPARKISIVQSLIKVAVGVLVIRFLYVYSRALAWLLMAVLVVGAAYTNREWIRDVIGRKTHQQHHQESDGDREHRLRMERINQDREESEALVEEAARMMLDINRRHLEDFVKENPSATYEDWIRNLHPENVEESGAIDHRFYVEDSDHRLLWNEMLEGHREYVATKSKLVNVEAGK